MRRGAAVVLEWLLIAAVSMAAMALVYPGLLVDADVRFTAGHDLEIPYQSAWVHAGYFLRGGVQLWNRLDQVNHAYYHLATGFQGLTAIAEGWLFSLFSGGLARPGEAFQAFHPIVFFTLGTLFRTAGGLALLSLYRVPFWARILTLLLANTLLAAQTYNGLLAGFMYSLAPLVLYFLVLFFRCFSVVTALWALLGVGLAFAQVPLIALGYFYMPIHFFVFCSVVAFGWWAWQARRTGPGTRSEAGFGNALSAPRLSWRQGLALAVGYGALATVLAMDVNYLGLLGQTFYIENSGLTGTSGRFDEMFAPITYLTKGHGGPDATLLPLFALDFTENRWWFSWQLIGSASLGFAYVGLTHGRHRERWLFGLAFVLTVLAQYPRVMPSLGLPAHVITGFTNPFAFLINNSHMSTLVMPYFLIVPIGLGMAALWRHAGEAPAPASRTADGVATAGLLAGALFALIALPLLSGLVVAAVFLAINLAVVAPRIAPLSDPRRLRALALGVPLAAVAADLYGYSVYLDDVPYTGDRIQPRSFDGIEAGDGRQINPVVIDYQNPATLTFPRHVRVEADPFSPTTDPAFPTDFAVYFIRQTYMAAYWNTIFLSRHFNLPHLYELRHAAYEFASNYADSDDPRSPDEQALYPLLASDDRALFFAQVAVAADTVGPAALVAADAGRWAVSLESPSGGPVPGALGALPDEPPSLPAQQAEQLDFPLTLGDAVARRQRAPALPGAAGFVEYDFPLPVGFPAWMATNLFTADRDDIRLAVDGQELAPAQGRLIRAGTFDVRNVATDRLVVALPADRPESTRLMLSVTIGGFLKAVQPNRNDTTGLTVEAPADGWLVWRAPYEAGWQASVDGDPVPLYVANRTAMAVALPDGRHEVVFAYKPAGSGSWTRRLVQAHLIASPLLALVVLGLVLNGAAAGYGRAPVLKDRESLR